MQDKNKTKSAFDCCPLSAAEAIVVESIENAVTKVTAIAEIRLKNDVLFGFFFISFSSFHCLLAVCLASRIQLCIYVNFLSEGNFCNNKRRVKLIIRLC